MDWILRYIKTTFTFFYKVTPSNFAYSTVSTRLPSMTMLGIEFLTLSSGVKQMPISFDFGELIFIQLFWVQSTVLSIDYCITGTLYSVIRKKHADPYSQTGFYCELGIVYDMYACRNTIWSCYERSSRISGSIIARNIAGYSAEGRHGK